MAQEEKGNRSSYSFEDAYAPVVPAGNEETASSEQKARESETTFSIKDTPVYGVLDENGKRELLAWQQRFTELLKLLYSAAGIELHREDPKANRKKISELIAGSLPAMVQGNTRERLISALTKDIGDNLDVMANRDYERLMYYAGLDDKLAQKSMTPQQRMKYIKARNDLLKEAEQGEFSGFIREVRRYQDEARSQGDSALFGDVFNPATMPKELYDHCRTPEHHPECVRFQEWMRERLKKKVHFNQEAGKSPLDRLGETEYSRERAAWAEKRKAEDLARIREEGVPPAGTIMRKSFDELASNDHEQFMRKHHVRSDDFAYNDGGRLYKEDVKDIEADKRFAEDMKKQHLDMMGFRIGGGSRPSDAYYEQSDKAADELAKVEGRLTNSGRYALGELVDRVSSDLYKIKAFRAMSGEQAAEELRRAVLDQAREDTKQVRAGALDERWGVRAYTERELADADRLLREAKPEFARNHAAIVPVLKDHDDLKKAPGQEKKDTIRPTDPKTPAGHGIPILLGRAPGQRTP